jgi:hypothetical protein
MIRDKTPASFWSKLSWFESVPQYSECACTYILRNDLIKKRYFHFQMYLNVPKSQWCLTVSGVWSGLGLSKVHAWISRIIIPLFFQWPPILQRMYQYLQLNWTMSVSEAEVLIKSDHSWDGKKEEGLHSRPVIGNGGLWIQGVVIASSLPILGTTSAWGRGFVCNIPEFYKFWNVQIIEWIVRVDWKSTCN